LFTNEKKRLYNEYMWNKIFNIVSWFIFLTAFTITTVVAISQNSIPGNRTYFIKTAFEKVVLSSYRLFDKDTDYEIDLTKIRFKESQKVLKTANASESLKNLNLQILSTSENIKNIEDADKKTAYARKYTSALKEMKTQLDYEKVSIVTSSNINTSFAVSSSDSSSGEKSVITDDIDNTRETIEEVIKDIEEEIPDDRPDTSESSYIIPTLVPTVNIVDTSTSGFSVEEELSPTPEVKNISQTPTPTAKP